MLEVCHGQGSLVTSKQDDLLCNICVDIVEDIDSWLTSDTTEQQIVDWLYAFCEVDLKEQNIIFIQCFFYNSEAWRLVKPRFSSSVRSCAWFSVTKYN